MQRRLRRALPWLLALLAVPAPPPAGAQGGPVSSPPLRFDGDGDVAAFFSDPENAERFATSGSGTAADPFVLADVEITASGGPGLHVSGTSLHVRFERVLVLGERSLDCFVLAGVRNVTLRTVRADGCRAGIVLSGVADVRVEDSTVTASGTGVLVASTRAGATLTENRLSSNDAGVRFVASTRNVLRANSLSIAGAQHGLFFEDGTLDNDVDPSNTVNEAALPWYVRRSGGSAEAVRMDVSRATNVAQLLVYASNGLRLTGARALNGAADGILIVDSVGVVLESATAELNAGAGVRITRSEGVVLEGASVRGNGREGIRGSDSSFAVRNATVASSGAHGILATGGVGVQLRSTTVSGNGGAAVEAARTRDLAVEANDLGGGHVGLRLDGVRGGRVERNVIHDVDRGVSLRHSTGNAIRENRITKGTGWGVFFEDPQSWTNAPSGNLVNGAALRWEAGLRGEVGAPLTLRGWSVSDPGAMNVAQILLVDARHVTLADATVTGSASNGTLVSGSEDVRVEGLRASAAALDGLVLRASSAVVVARLNATDNGGAGVAVRGESRGVTIRDAELSGNRNGIVFAESGGGVTGGVVRGAHGSGLAMRGAHGVSASRLAVKASGTAVSVEGSDHVHLSALLLEANRQGISIRDSLDARVENATIRGGSVGVHVESAPEFHAYGNSIRGTGAAFSLARTQGARVAATSIWKANESLAFRVEPDALDNDLHRSNLVNGERLQWWWRPRGASAGSPLPLAVEPAEVQNVTNVAQVVIYEAQHVTVPSVVAANGTSTGILVRGGRDVTLQAPEARGNPGVGIVVEGAHTVRVHSARAHHNAVGVSVRNSTSVSVHSGNYSDNREGGIRVSTSSLVRLEGVLATGAAGPAVAMFSVNGSNVTGSSLSGGAAGALRLDRVTASGFNDSALRGTLRVLVLKESAGNDLRGLSLSKAPAGTAIEFVDSRSFDNAVDGSTRVGNEPIRWLVREPGGRLSDVNVSTPGISNVAQVLVYASPDARIEGSSVSRGRASGILIVESPRARIAGNRVESNAGAGIDVRDGTSPLATIVGNALRANGAGIVVDAGSGAAHVADNRIERGSVGIDVLNATGAVVSGNEVRNATIGVTLRESRASKLVDNLVGGADDGLRLRGVADSTISGNNVTARRNGLVLAATHRNAFHSNLVWKPASGIGLSFLDETSYRNDLGPTNLVSGEALRWIVSLAGRDDARVVVENLTATVPRMTNVAQIMVFQSSFADLVAPTATGGAAAGIVLWNSSNVRLRDPVAEGNAADGIVLHASKSNVVERAIVRWNGASGILLEEAESNVLLSPVATGSRRGVTFADPLTRSNRLHGLNASGVSEASVLLRTGAARNLVADAGLDRAAEAGATVAFEGWTATSHLLSSPVTAARWDLGDGTPPVFADPGTTITHAYPGIGVYVARMLIRVDDVAYEDETIVRILPHAPLSPRNLSAAFEEGGVQIRWLAPESVAQGVAVRYAIYRSVDGGAREGMDGEARSLRWRDGNVELGRAYRYWVAAVSIGPDGSRHEGVPAGPVLVEARTPPGAPPRLVARLTEEGRVALEWEAPRETGGAALVSYRVYRRVEGEPLASALAETEEAAFEDEAPPLGQLEYAVSAVNAAGEGPRSAAARASFGAAPPPPPGVRADRAEGGVTVAWEAPAVDSLHPVLRYHVHRFDGRSPSRPIGVTPAGELRFFDPSPPADVPLEYSVSAESALGEGRPARAPLVTFLRPPSPPTQLVATLDGARVLLAWGPPSDDARSVEAYQLKRRAAEGGATAEWRLAGDVRSFEDGVPPGNHTLEYELRALGPGGASPPARASVYVGATPGPPLRLEGARAPGARHLRWAPPAEGGDLTYVVDRSVGNGSWERVGETKALFWSDRDPVPADAGVAYEVRAINVAGVGAPSERLALEPGTLPAPAVPGGDVARAPGPGWSALLAIAIGVALARRRPR